MCIANIFDCVLSSVNMFYCFQTKRRLRWMLFLTASATIGHCGDHKTSNSVFLACLLVWLTGRLTLVWPKCVCSSVRTVALKGSVWTSLKAGLCSTLNTYADTEGNFCLHSENFQKYGWNERRELMEKCPAVKRGGSEVVRSSGETRGRTFRKITWFGKTLEHLCVVRSPDRINQWFGTAGRRLDRKWVDS